MTDERSNDLNRSVDPTGPSRWDDGTQWVADTPPLPPNEPVDPTGPSRSDDGTQWVADAPPPPTPPLWTPPPPTPPPWTAPPPTAPTRTPPPPSRVIRKRRIVRALWADGWLAMRDLFAAPPTRNRRFPRWAKIASAAVVVAVIAGLSIASVANSRHTKARAAAASSSSAAQSASAAAQSAAESQAAKASSAAQAASESAAAKALNLHSGDTASLTSTNDDGTTSEFTMKVVIHRNAKPTGEFTLPAEKGQYVVADVTIKVARGSYDYNPFYFQGQSGNGQIWEPTIPIGFDPALDAGTAAAGQTARGNVVFDVPRGPTQVQLTGGLGQSTPAAWNG
jgi:hypothetical protein